MASTIMHQNVDDASLDPDQLDPEAQLARDWALFQSVETGTSDSLLPMLARDPAGRRRRTE